MNTAFDLAFESWPPASPPVRHRHAAPVGAIRYATKGKSRCRMIKVRLDGPPARRWMKLARFWWLKNKGLVPEGRRVGHVDGDSLNDDPRNYALFTPGDVIACWHLDHPELSARQRLRCAAGTARFNRERAAAERMHRWLPGYWYGVDFTRRVIHNDPKRKRWQVYAAHGVADGCAANGRGVEAAALGWRGCSTLGAAILACLAAQGPLRTRPLYAAVQALYVHHRWQPPERRRSLHSVLSGLRVRGLIESRRLGRRGSEYALTAAGLACRVEPCPVVAVRGIELEAKEFVTFTRATAGAELAA